MQDQTWGAGMGGGPAEDQALSRVQGALSHRSGNDALPAHHSNGGGEDNSQNGLITDVWDQLRICLFKSNFKY